VLLPIVGFPLSIWAFRVARYLKQWGSCALKYQSIAFQAKQLADKMPCVHEAGLNTRGSFSRPSLS